MKIKKRIGEIFRDEFRAVETTPPDDVWKNIELSLEKNRKKRFAIPLWYRAAGVAAVLAVFFGVLFSPNAESEHSKSSKVSDFGVERTVPEISLVKFSKIMKGSSILLESLVHQSRMMPSSFSEENATHILRRERSNSELLVTSKTNFGLIVISSALDFLHPPQEELDLVHEKVDYLKALGEEKIQTLDPKIEEKLIDRLAISTIAGIVYADNLGKANFLDPELSSYSTHGETSVSYGVKVGYELTERLNIRTGFSTLDLGYRTDDVGFSSAITAEAVDAVGINENYSFTGNLSQNIGFFEVPVELSYALVNKKIRLNLIGGFSSLFLKRNSLSLNGLDLTMDLGAANNLNTVSISGNVGLGLNYSLQNNLHLTIEPIFKYQFSTFKNVSSEVAPYMMGLHSGLIYRF